MSHWAELQPGIIIFIKIASSCNIPGGSLKIIHQIRSKGFLVIKTHDPPMLFSYQISVFIFNDKANDLE
jgi:hypothetical protein